MNNLNSDWLKTMPIAHRGLHTNDKHTPENSMKAFEKAIEANYAIELDIHVTTDQMVVVFHDDSLKRMCGIKRNVSTITASELDFFKLKKSTETIPLLKTVFNLVNGKVPILIEIKNQTDIKNANAIILNVLSEYTGLVAIQSFNPFIMSWFADNAPHLLRGQLSSDFKNEKMNFIKKLLLRSFMFNRFSRPHFIAYDINDITNQRIAKMRKKGLPILGWTVSNKVDYDYIKPYCDNIIFEGFNPNH